MTPQQLAVKSWELAKALETMSPNSGEGITVLMGAMAILVASSEVQDPEEAWNKCITPECKAMFLKYFVETKVQIERLGVSR